MVKGIPSSNLKDQSEFRTTALLGILWWCQQIRFLSHNPQSHICSPMPFLLPLAHPTVRRALGTSMWIARPHIQAPSLSPHASILWPCGPKMSPHTSTAAGGHGKM